MKRLESFREWLVGEENRLGRRGFLAGALAAGASGLLGSSSKGANVPVGSSDLPPPEDSIGMSPQIRIWDNVRKSGHMENFDQNFVYIRFTDSPDVLSKILRSELSERDKEYVGKHEAMLRSRNRYGSRGPTQQTYEPSRPGSSSRPFNPDYGPKPLGIKKPTPMQVWKYQFNLVTKAEEGMARGRKPPIDYVILYRYYDGKMPDPPEE